MKSTTKAAAPKKAAAKPADGFSDFEKEAMKERAAELKAQKKRGGAAADATAEVLARIAKMEEPDRTLAKRVHDIIMAAAPALSPRLWYGMPAYARDGETVIHFQDAKKFKARYATIGFSDKARLDDGTMWPVGYGLMPDFTKADEAKLTALIRKAVG